MEKQKEIRNRSPKRTRFRGCVAAVSLTDGKNKFRKSTAEQVPSFQYPRNRLVVKTVCLPHTPTPLAGESGLGPTWELQPRDLSLAWFPNRTRKLDQHE